MNATIEVGTTKHKAEVMPMVYGGLNAAVNCCSDAR
jgi:hypothetical protein